MSDDVGLRERKKRRTRAALGRAAFELCLEHGYEAVTVADIAARADVSTRTFFNYFSSKEEALLGGTDRAERLVVRLAGRPADEPLWDALRATVADELLDEQVPSRDQLHAQMRLVIEHPALLQQQLMLWLDMEERLVAEVARRTGAAPDALAPRLVIAAAVAAIRVALTRWVAHPTDESLHAAIDTALATISQAFPGPDRPATP